MSRYQSTIMEMDREFLGKLTQLLAEEEIDIVKAPQTGLLMMVARDPFETDFCLGEILITEAETEYQGRRGYAMVLGEKPDRAMLTAAVEAICQSRNEALKKHLERLLAEASSSLREKEEWERKILAASLVGFETMVKG
jgi:phosphonate C-P lyase system protein PhnG